jgi:hypothetical protein
MTTALLIGWVVVASLGAPVLFVLWRREQRIARLARAARDSAYARFWNERQEHNASVMAAHSKYTALHDDYEALRKAAFPSTASVKDQDMTKAEIRAIWEKAPGFTAGMTIEDGCQCALFTVGRALGYKKISGTTAMVEAGINPIGVVDANDAFEGTPQERRDHMIALLDAGKLDA